MTFLCANTTSNFNRPTRPIERWRINAIEEGEARGLAKGYVKGLLQGMAKILDRRFGQKSKWLFKLQDLTDAELLGELTVLVATASTLDEFLEALP